MAGLSLEQNQLDTARKQHGIALQAVLTDFQFMEEALRMYISGAYRLIRTRLASSIPFGLNDSSLERDALGKLIEKFSQLSANAELANTMRTLVPKRNAVAHRGFLYGYHPETRVDEIDKLTCELESLNVETSSCLAALIDELKVVERLNTPAT